MTRVLVAVVATGLLIAGFFWFVSLTPGSSTTTTNASVKAVPSDEPADEAPTSRRRIGTSASATADAPAETAPARTPPIPPEKRAKPVYTPDPDDDRALVGLTYTGLSDGDRERLKVPERFGRGVIITKIHPDAPAVLAGLEVDDVIVRARRTAVNSIQDLETTIGDREHTVLTVARDGQLFHVVLHKPYIPSEAPGP